MSHSKISSLSALALAFTALTSTARASIPSGDQPSTPTQAGAQAIFVSDHPHPAPHHRPHPAPHPKPVPPHGG
jgi:hypothetical protein